MSDFKRLYKNIDKVLLLLPLAFAGISLVMVSSTASQNGFVMTRDVMVQGIAYILGYIIIAVLLFFDYRIFRVFDKLLYALSIAFLLSVYIPGLGIEQFGSRAWIDLKLTTLQPSEFVKISFVILLASYLSKHAKGLTELKEILKALLFSAPLILIVLKEDLGSALVFMFIWLVMVYFAGISHKWLGIGLACGAAALPGIYLLLDPYQKNRILAFLHPEDLSLPGNYQVWQSKVAIGSGGVFGKGLFKGTQKALKFLPVQKSDFIFAVIVEELGAVGGMAVIALYAFFISRFVRITRDSQDLFAALISVGFMAMFIFQIFENIAMTMGLMPVTGITLPLISYGGSSVLSSMIAIGVVLNISMRSKTLNF